MEKLRSWDPYLRRLIGVEQERERISHADMQRDTLLEVAKLYGDKIEGYSILMKYIQKNNRLELYPWVKFLEKSKEAHAKREKFGIPHTTSLLENELESIIAPVNESRKYSGKRTSGDWTWKDDEDAFGYGSVARKILEG